MQSFIIVPCLVAATIALQGCGGGGTTPPPPPGPVTQACVNPQIDVKSQSFKSTTKMQAVTTVANIKTKEDTDGTGTMKIDMEEMNLYENTVYTISTTIPGQEAASLKLEQKIIVNVAKKVIVESMKVSNATSGKVLIANCSVVTVDQMPAVPEVSLAFKAFILPQLQKVAKCSANDGTYDHYDMKINIKGASIPGLKMLSDVNVQGTETILLDKDYLMHSSIGNLSASANWEGLGPITVDETVSSTTTDAETGGPTAADLDWSLWGKCTPLKTENVGTLFQPTKPSEITNKFNNKAFFKNQLLAAIQATMKATKTKQLIV